MRPARHYSELIVWQLGEELRRHIFELTARPKFASDFKARSQLDDAIDSVCRNIAEGFGADTNAEFANFLVYSLRSLNEVQDAVQLKRYAGAEDVKEIRMLFRRLYPALTRFIAHLRRTPRSRRNKFQPPPSRPGGQPKPGRTDKDPRRTNKR